LTKGSTLGEDGSNLSKISPKGEYSSLRWSPDGKKLSCVKKTGKQEQPCIFSIGISGAVLVKSEAYVNSIPSWSPDSKTIIFSCNEKDISYSENDPPSSICTYDIYTKRLNVIAKPPKLGLLAPIFISVNEIAYVDDCSSAIIFRDLITNKCRKIKVVEGDISMDFEALEMIPFADSMVVVAAAEQGTGLNPPVPLTPGKPSWFPRMLKRLHKSLGKLTLYATELTPCADSKSAYLVLNNESDLSGDVVPQSRAYKIDPQGSHLLFAVIGNYWISHVSPIGGNRFIYTRLTAGYDSEQGDLRIYDVNKKSSKLFREGVTQYAIWPRLQYGGEMLRR